MSNAANATSRAVGGQCDSSNDRNEYQACIGGVPSMHGRVCNRLARPSIPFVALRLALTPGGLAWLAVVCGVQLSFGWSAELDTAPTAWLAVANATFRHGNWHRHQYPVPLSDNTDPSARIPVFSAIITGPGDFAAIDDVEIDCGASNATVGECQCMDGFANNATDGSVTCEAIPGEVADREVADVVATCPERAECRGKTRCTATSTLSWIMSDVFFDVFLRGTHAPCDALYLASAQCCCLVPAIRRCL